LLDPTKRIEVELGLKKDKFEDELRNVGKSSRGLKSLSGRLQQKQSQLEKSILKDRLKLDSPQATKAQQTAARKTIRFKQTELAITKQQLKETKGITAELAKQAKFNKSFSGTMGGRPTGGGLAGAAGMLGKMGIGAAISAVGALAGAVKQQIADGYAIQSQYQAQQGKLVGTGATQAQLRKAKNSGLGLGFSGIETMQQAGAAARATGQAGSVTYAQSMARMTGMDAGEASNFMGQMTRGGSGFGGKAGDKGPKALEKVLAAGFKSGLDQARLPEFFQGVGKLVEMQGGRQGGDVGTGGFSKILAAFGMTGDSGMQGARGANALAQLNEAMVKPGGGDAGQALMLQAYGFGKPGGETSYYDALKRQETGASSAANVKDLFGETARQYGSGESQILALREMTGLSITQLEAMREGIDNLDDAGLEKAIKESQPVEKQALDEMKELGKHSLRIARLNERMREIGEENQTSVENFQDATLEVLDALLPLGKMTYDKIAEIAKAVTFTAFGDDTKGYAKGSSADVLKQNEENLAALARGEITSAEFASLALASGGTVQSIASNHKTTHHEQGKARSANAFLARQKNLFGASGIGGRAQDLAYGKGSFDTGTETGAKMQGMLQQFRFAAQAAASTKDGGKDDEEVRNMLKEGGAFWPLMQQFILAAMSQTENVDKMIIHLADGDVSANTAKAGTN